MGQNILDISEKEQEKRFKKLLESKDTAWRVTEKELARNAHYGKHKKLSDEMIRRTDMPYAPWYVIDAKEKGGTALVVIKTVADVLEKALEKKRAGKEAEIFEKPVPPDRYEKGILAKADLTKRLEEAEYRKKLDKLQKRLEVLHGELYRLRIPVILGFEGWDAAGKGGAIKRLTSHLDPADIRSARQHPRTMWKNPITISGASGIMFRRQDTSRSLTAPGTEESWWSGSRASVPRRTGTMHIGRSTRWKHILCTPGLLS